MADEKWGAGDKSKWHDWGKIRLGGDRETPLIYGEHPHSRSDNRMYVLDGGSEPTPFDGHRILIDVTLRAENYRKESHYSGDEIRKGGQGLIFADRIQVYEFFFRDTEWALLRARDLVGTLLEHSSRWLLKEDREKLVGRPIFYERTPAFIKRLIVEQGAIILATADGEPFPPPVYAKPGEGDREAQINTDVLDPKIWWFREKGHG